HFIETNMMKKLDLKKLSKGKTSYLCSISQYLYQTEAVEQRLIGLVDASANRTSTPSKSRCPVQVSRISYEGQHCPTRQHILEKLP
ncbi:hypothetical protein HAX54_042778, partial [Datura stramonium]|nr:hypothetical protein [Datura stramonium]